MQLFKHLILQKTNLSPSIVKTFEANLHTCSECLQLILALCGMNQQIIAIQREMDKIVDSVKNSLQERDNQLDNPTPVESWSSLPLEDDDLEPDDEHEDPILDIEFGIDLGSNSDSNKHDDESSNVTETRGYRKRRWTPRTAKRKALQFLSEVKSEPESEDEIFPQFDPFLDNSYENEGQDDDQKLPGKINSPPKCKINLLRKRRRKFSPKKVVTQSLNGKPPSCAKKTRGHNKATTVDQFKLRPPSTPDGKFPCSKCGKIFTNWRSVLSHEITVCKIHHDKGKLVKLNFKLFECDKCDKKFVFIKDYERHKYIHLRVKPFLCEKCGKNFSQKQALTYHEKVYCKKQEPDVELRKKLRQLKLQLDRDKYKNYKFPCDACQRRYPTQQKLDDHIKRPHKMVTKFQKISCDICEEEMHIHLFISHKRDIHKIAGSHKCQQCKKGFYSANGLQKHVKSVHVREQVKETSLDHGNDQEDNSNGFSSNNSTSCETKAT
ncbi:zinc finger protein 93 isoform X2 [Folsomia candida]|nr:zinc finger protein 93 isoform X2 [Folsomia candida]